MSGETRRRQRGIVCLLVGPAIAFLAWQLDGPVTLRSVVGWFGVGLILWGVLEVFGDTRLHDDDHPSRWGSEGRDR